MDMYEERPAARSKAWTVFARSNAGIVGANPTQGMDVSVRLFYVYVLCVGRGLAMGLSPVQGVYRLWIWSGNWEKWPRLNKGLLSHSNNNEQRHSDLWHSSYVVGVRKWGKLRWIKTVTRKRTCNVVCVFVFVFVCVREREIPVWRRPIRRPRVRRDDKCIGSQGCSSWDWDKSETGLRPYSLYVFCISCVEPTDILWQLERNACLDPDIIDLSFDAKGKVKVSLLQAMEVHRVARG
jgi:hypothetical protein